MCALADSVSFEQDMMWVDLLDGRKLGIPLAYFPRLLNAKPEQLPGYEISGGGTGLHWDELDVDISVEYLLLGIGDRTRQQGSRLTLPLERGVTMLCPAYMHVGDGTHAHGIIVPDFPDCFSAENQQAGSDTLTLASQATCGGAVTRTNPNP